VPGWVFLRALLTKAVRTLCAGRGPSTAAYTVHVPAELQCSTLAAAQACCQWVQLQIAAPTSEGHLSLCKGKTGKVCSRARQLQQLRGAVAPHVLHHKCRPTAQCKRVCQLAIGSHATMKICLPASVHPPHWPTAHSRLLTPCLREPEPGAAAKAVICRRRELIIGLCGVQGLLCGDRDLRQQSSGAGLGARCSQAGDVSVGRRHRRQLLKSSGQRLSWQMYGLSRVLQGAPQSARHPAALQGQRPPRQSQRRAP